MIIDEHGQGAITAIVGDEYGTTIVSADNTTTNNVIVWDAVTGKCSPLGNHAGVVFLQMSPDGAYVVSQSRNRNDKSVLYQLYSDGTKEDLKKIINKN